MAWFSLWAPLALQLIVPLLLVWWVAAGAQRPVSRVGTAVLTGLYLIAIGLAGLWLVLPWWLPFVFAALLAVAAARASTGASPRKGTSTMFDSVRLLALGLGGVALLAIILVALMARRPTGETVDLASPLGGGTYLVVNGGSHVLVNAHLGTLEGERFRPYRGQSFGVDLVRIDRLGLRARGLLPSDPAAFQIFGDIVSAPCAGRVVAAQDEAPDMSPPQPDRSHMAGNFVMLDCSGTWVMLGHLQRGSVSVHDGDTVATGVALGRVGNSGNSGEPHLHLHAQRPGTDAEPMSGEPLAIRIDGRYLARNARVTPGER